MATLDIEQLRTFLAVEKTRNFTQAADLVARTQSAVSMQIKRLEEQVGHRLFLRGTGTTRGRIKVTPEGERLLPYARDIVGRSAEALAAFDETALSGKVALGTADDYAERYLPAILAGFSESNPLVEVSVVCESTFGLQQRVRSGELDVAIVTHNEINRASELLRIEPLLWVTSSRHGAHRADPLPLALGSPHCSWREQALRRLDVERRAWRLLYTSYSATVISSAVMSGLAVSVLPESAVRPQMRVLTERDGFPPLSPCEIGIMHGSREGDPVVQGLVDHIRRSLEVLAPRQMTERPEDVPLASLMEIAGRPRADLDRLQAGHIATRKVN